MRAVGTWQPRYRAFALSLALAVALAAVPLQRLAAAARDPVRLGAGIGTRVPLALETGARLVTPGTAVGTLRTPTLPRHTRGTERATQRRSLLLSSLAAALCPTLLLTVYGRFQLEGG